MAHASLSVFSHFKKKSLAQVFSCTFFEIFKNMFSYRTLLLAAVELTLENPFTAIFLSKRNDDINIEKKSSEFSIVIFTDYSKAFGTINFFILLTRIHPLSFSKRFSHWMFYYLPGR